MNKDIELVMHVLNVAAVSMSVDSFLEYHISTIEKQATKSRNLGEKRATAEMQVAINGPSLKNKKSVVVSAMSAYFSAKKELTGWHFVRRSSSIKNYIHSKVIDRLNEENSHLPFTN